MIKKKSLRRWKRSNKVKRRLRSKLKFSKRKVRKPP